MVPSTNTLYLSNDLELNSNTISNLWNKTLSKINPSATNAVLNYRNIFNQDNQKALEYIVGHELGHFFLQLKNKDKPLLTKNPIVSQCALNIEESFSEIFSLHIMCLKHHLNENSNDFPKLKDYRINNEKHRLRYFKNNPTEKEREMTPFEITPENNFLLSISCKYFAVICNPDSKKIVGK